MSNILRSQRLKDAIDRLGAFVGLIITSPIFLIVAIILKIQKENVFFIHDRVGLNQKEFKMFKFTTMKKGSEKRGTITTANDSRVTLLGRILRRFKLNEIPQLINILKGEMSFVGPRPLPKTEVEKYYSPEVRSKIYSVKPGITGCGSIEFSDEEERLDKVDDVEKYFAEIIMPKKAELEIWYVDNRNLILDLKLFFKTIFKLLTGFGQYFIVRFLTRRKR
jgi:lipopolysaccharide/colanic/teichoic acid biosynthesis glycosyltransferase